MDATGFPCSTKLRTKLTNFSSARSLSAPTVPPGMTTASKSSAFTSAEPSSALSSSPGSRSLRLVVTVPASLETSTVSAPASFAASIGCTSSSCSVPLGATKNAILLPCSSVAMSSLLGVRLDRLYFHLDAHLVGHQHAARLQSLVPFEAPVAPVYLARGLEADPLLAPPVLPTSLEQDVERHGLGGVGDGQVPAHPEAGALLRRGADRLGAAEHDRGLRLGVEEVGAAQVPVAVGGSGIQAGGLDSHLGPGGIGRFTV